MTTKSTKTRKKPAESAIYPDGCPPEWLDGKFYSSQIACANGLGLPLICIKRAIREGAPMRSNRMIAGDEIIRWVWRDELRLAVGAGLISGDEKQDSLRLQFLCGTAAAKRLRARYELPAIQPTTRAQIFEGLGLHKVECWQIDQDWDDDGKPLHPEWIVR